MMDRDILLFRMEASLMRMESDGAREERCLHYIEFKRKYDAIKAGTAYTTTNVAPALIAAYAAQIPRANFGTGGLAIKPRGDVRAVVESAEEFVKGLSHL